MASCGISLNLSSLESKISAHISGALGIANLAGFPFTGAYLSGVLKIARGDFLGAIKIVVPEEALEGLWSGLRSNFDSVFSAADVPVDIGAFDGSIEQIMADNNIIGTAGSYDWNTDPANISGGDSFFGKLASTGKTFGSSVAGFAKESGLDQLSGFVDINVGDLAKTAIGLGGSFDSCDYGTSGIQNYFQDPATGTVKLLANYAPKLGNTDVAKRNSVWGLTAAVNTAFQIGKANTQLNLNVALGNAATQFGTYTLDSLGRSIVDNGDIQSLTSWMRDEVAPRNLNSLRRDLSGLTSIYSLKAEQDECVNKTVGRLAASEDYDKTLTLSAFAGSTE